MSELDPREVYSLLNRIASALEQLAPSSPPSFTMDGSDVFVWQPEGPRLEPVARPNRLEIDLLRGIARNVGWDVVEVPGATGYVDTRTPCASLKACRPTTRCYGEPGAQESLRS